MLRCEFEDALAIELVDGELVAPNLASAVDVHFPDFDNGVFIDSRVEEAHVDPTAESLVKGPDTVGGEEEDARVVFEDLEEYRDDCIAFEILLQGTHRLRLVVRHNPICERAGSDFEPLLNFVGRIADVTTSD